jgi:hypothetical protein
MKLTSATPSLTIIFTLALAFAILASLQAATVTPSVISASRLDTSSSLFHRQAHRSQDHAVLSRALMKRGIWYPGLAAIVALSIAGLVVLGLAVYYLRKAMGINGQRRVVQNG